MSFPERALLRTASVSPLIRETCEKSRSPCPRTPARACALSLEVGAFLNGSQTKGPEVWALGAGLKRCRDKQATLGGPGVVAI